MPVDEVSLDALTAFLGGAAGAAPWAAWELPGVVLVDLDAGPAPDPAPRLHGGVRAVVVGLTGADRPEEHDAAGACDVVVAPGGAALDAVVATVETSPRAAGALAGLLRASPHRSIDAGLTAESGVYSALLGGPEFAAWRASRPRRHRAGGGAPVGLARDGGVLRVRLDRPEVRNAVDAAVRDGLVDAFRLVAADDSITEVRLTGSGPDFCAGGDLDEFGSFPDTASAHLLRLQQSAGRAIAAVADRVTAEVHGACVGSGIELPAFAARVHAAPDARFSLPEVRLGLVPGAGGTVSLPRRIGRHRTARLALTCEVVDAATALAWGLVDAVGDG